MAHGKAGAAAKAKKKAERERLKAAGDFVNYDTFDPKAST